MKYERFTKKRNSENVIPLINGVCGVDLPKWCISEESDIRSYLSGDAVDRLAELEDKIENGTLVELPCKVGDTVYMIWIDRLDENNAPIHKIQSGNIFAIQLENKEGKLDIWLRVEFGLTYCCRRIKDFYLTKAEAEQN